MPTWRSVVIKIKRKAVLLSFILIPCFIIGYISYPYNFTTSNSGKNENSKNEKLSRAHDSWAAPAVFPFSWSSSEQEKSSQVSQSPSVRTKSPPSNLNLNVHAFYYAWYGAPEVDGKWVHWNHEYIPPWDKNDHHVYPTGAHHPPLDIGANFYPELGPYSSRDPAVIAAHIKMMAAIGIGVLSVSWYPPGLADENGLPTDAMIPVLLDAAQRRGMKVCLHVEPYEGRNASNFRHYLQYVHQHYGSHPAYYRVKRGSRALPLFYVYDSYRVTVEEWQKVLSPRGNISVRNTELDAIFIGLLVETKHRFDIKAAGFDGYYTYFAANGFSYGSSWKNWKSLATFAYKNSLIFIPSVGPGYVDTRVRPWNTKNTHARRKGLYYETAWRTAVGAPSKMVSITSFNEWHEGTMIEPAIPMRCENYTYEDYQPNNPDYYMQLTSKWVKEFSIKK